jgi:hypothetical protein
MSSAGRAGSHRTTGLSPSPMSEQEQYVRKGTCCRFPDVCMRVGSKCEPERTQESGGCGPPQTQPRMLLGAAASCKKVRQEWTRAPCGFRRSRVPRQCARPRTMATAVGRTEQPGHITTDPAEVTHPPGCQKLVQVRDPSTAPMNGIVAAGNTAVPAC